MDSYASARTQTPSLLILSFICSCPKHGWNVCHVSGVQKGLSPALFLRGFQPRRAVRAGHRQRAQGGKSLARGGRKGPQRQSSQGGTRAEARKRVKGGHVAVCVRGCVRACMCAFSGECACVCLRVYTCVCVYMCECIQVCICV